MEIGKMIKNKPSLLVLAAGMGSRYGGLKQLDEVGPSGETIIDYSIYDAVRTGFGKVVFVIRRDIEAAFREKVGSRYEGVVDVAYVFQELSRLPSGFRVPEGRSKPWGTGHAILMAKDVINEPFAVINADDFYGADGYASAFDHLSRLKDEAASEYCMVGYSVCNTLSSHGAVSRGICQYDGAGLLGDVVEAHGIQRREGVISYPDSNAPDRMHVIPDDQVVSMNLWGFGTSIFRHLEHMFSEFLVRSGSELKSEFYIPSVVNALIRSGEARVKVIKCGAEWFGVTYREDREEVIERVGRLVRAGIYNSPLWSVQHGGLS